MDIWNQWTQLQTIYVEAYSSPHRQPNESATKQRLEAFKKHLDKLQRLFHQLAKQHPDYVQKGTLVQVGEVQARNATAALKKALHVYVNPKAIVWWVFPVNAIHRTDPAENESLFGPAESKPFRHSKFYPTVTLMREINMANEKLNWEDE